MNKKLIIITSALVGVLGAGGAGFISSNRFTAEAYGHKAPSDKHAKNEKQRQKRRTWESSGRDLRFCSISPPMAGPQRYLRTTLSLGVKDTHEKKIKEFAGPIRHA